MKIDKVNIAMMTMWCVRACGLNSLVDFFNVNLRYMRGKCDNKEEILNQTHVFPRILGYNRRIDIMEVRVFMLFEQASQQMHSHKLD
jgi:hypothetical protein